MKTRFSPDDVSRTSRIMRALLPTGFDVICQSVSDGWEMSVSICGPEGCNESRFTRSMTDRHLLILAECWKTGHPVRSGDEFYALERQAMVAQSVTLANDLMGWLRTAPKGDKVQYFRGNLAQFRFDAPRRIVQLQSLADRATKKHPRPTSEADELTRLQEQQDLIAKVQHLADANLVMVVQNRIPDGSGATYYAIKR